MTFPDGRRIFSVSELWGPMRCDLIKKDGKKCKRECWSILLSRAENESLPTESGPDAVAFIFLNNLGVALCERHLPTK